MQTVDLSQPLEADLGWNEEKKYCWKTTALYGGSGSSDSAGSSEHLV